MEDVMSDHLDTAQDAEDEHMEQKIVNEEYKIWKKNSVFLYDLLYSRALEWPTLTIQWLPDKKEIPGTEMSQHRVLFGTITTGQAQNYIQIASIEMPNPANPDPKEYDDQQAEIGGHGNAKKPYTFNVIQKINHPGDINKARYQPQNPNLIATFSSNGNVYVFDRTKHTSQPKPDGEVQFELELAGHQMEGYGLDWSPFHEGQLATSSEDKTVRLWDIKDGFTKGNKHVTPKATYNKHAAFVNDVRHHPVHDMWIGTVSDDLTFQVIDTRNSPKEPAVFNRRAHNDALNCLAWHPKWDTLVATGSADKTVALWDLRMLKHKLHSFEAHTDSVVSVEWHPQDSTILASSSYDRRIIMWDTSKCGEEQTEEDMEEGPPEMIFMHGGFTNRVSDFNWNKNDPWVMLAAAEDNQLQIFRPARSIVEAPKRTPQISEVHE
ncbi:WD40-repeat-containing domain protein [Lineolata rhizophorae]|uniref:WD40-repeat-containing domain protein n=1 Tax=Lineolata rhizophorae TaxID=578093 RepID=A0A6A6NW14_9PEZI|nr:WD40-repeat-containing domain protein [Lineolata rhizophorae]